MRFWGEKAKKAMNLKEKITQKRRVLKKNQLTIVQKHGAFLVIALVLLGIIIGSSWTFVYCELSKTTTVKFYIDNAQAKTVGEVVEKSAVALAVHEQSESTDLNSGDLAMSDSSQNIALIKKIAKEENFSEVENLLRLAKCESGFNSKAFNPTNYSNDRGIFQISQRWHPTVTDKQAYDVEFSTRWTINKIKNGGLKLWMCSGVWDDVNY